MAQKKQDIRQALERVLLNELEQLPEILASLTTEQRIEVLIKLAPYVLPKVSAVKYEPTVEASPWGFTVSDWDN